MSDPPPPPDEPPEEVRLTIDEALDLLAGLEDARDALISSRFLTVVVIVEAEIRMLSRRLGYDELEGGS